MNNSSEEKLLGVTFDNDFSCITHVKNMCEKASKRLQALYRVCKYITLNQRRTIMKAFIELQFGYCSLVWIFHGNRTLNNTMNNIQERSLRLVYTDYSSSSDQLLAKDRSYRIHHRSLQRISIEIYKLKNNLGPEILIDIFEASSNTYNTRSDKIINTRNVKSLFNGTETVSYRAQKTWDIVHEHIKISYSLTEFLSLIKKWQPNNCTCRLCKTYVEGIGFVDIIDQV